jgi:lipopolysaccharide export system permease protein
MRLANADFVAILPALPRIDRYLFREIALPFVVSVLLVVTSVFLLQARRLATAALGFGLELEDAAIIFAAALPPFLIMAVPVAYLLSVLVGFGRLAGDLELVALRAAGAGPFRIARVPLVFGALVALGTVPVAVYGEPYGLRLLHARLIEVGMRNLTGAIRPGVFNEDFRGSAVYASGREANGMLTGIVLYDERDPEKPALITAEHGTFTTERDKGIRFVLENGEIHLGRTSTVTRYDRVQFERARLGLDAEKELSRRTSFVSVVGRMTNEEMLQQVNELGPASPLSRRIEKMYWRRFAFPSMAFVLGAIAAAIALTGSAKSRARSSLLGMGAIVFYYVLTRIADFLVVQYEGTPFWCAWIPNLLMLAIGTGVLLRSGRPRR